MKELLRPAQAGTVESSDILIVLSPAEPGTGINVELVSPTLQQYGRQIVALIKATLISNDIVDALVHANDKGALDCTIQARLTTAILRSTETEGK